MIPIVFLLIHSLFEFSFRIRTTCTYYMMKTKWVDDIIQVQYVRSHDREDICRMLEKESVC